MINNPIHWIQRTGSPQPSAGCYKTLRGLGLLLCLLLGLLSSCKTEKSLRDSRISWVQEVLSASNGGGEPILEREVIRIGEKNMEFLTLEKGKIILVPAVESLNEEIAGRLINEMNQGRRILWLGADCFADINKGADSSSELPYISRLSPLTERAVLEKAQSLKLEEGTTGQFKRYALKRSRDMQGARQGRFGGNGNRKVEERDIVLMRAQGSGDVGGLTVAMVHLRKGDPQEGERPIRWGWLALDPVSDLAHGDESAAWAAALTQVVDLLKEDRHLLGAGPDFLTTSATPEIRVQQLGSSSEEAAPVVYRLSALQEQQSKEWSGNLGAGGNRIALPADLPSGEYLLEVEIEGQLPAAVLTSRFFVGEDTDPKMEPLQVSGANFQKSGKTFPIVGVNYWSFSAQRNGPEEYAEPDGWMEPQVYDPVEIERDLGLLKEYGINAVSIQIRGEKNIPALRDFLRRCRRHQIYVHAYLPNLFTIERDFSITKKVIEGAELVKQEHIFAYDVAWEAHLGRQKRRDEVLAADWKKWIKTHYGSITKAEKAMTFPLRLDSWGDPQTPWDSDLAEDDDHRYMTLAFRRFFSNWLSMHYGEIKRFLRAQGLTAAIGARSGYGGTGNPWADRFLPADLQDGARHFDYIGPEIWHLHGEEVREATSIAAYSHYVGRGKKPVLWIEFGEDVLGKASSSDEVDEALEEQPESDEVTLQYGEVGKALKKLIPSTSKLSRRAGRLISGQEQEKPATPDGEELQQKHFREMVQMTRQSGSSGFFAWWFPGGFRPLEKTDYGLLTHALTPRPALLEMRKLAEEEMIEWNKGKVISAPGPVDARGFSAWWESQREVGRHALDGQINLRLQPFMPEGQELPAEASLTSDNAPMLNISGLPMGVHADTLEDVPFYFNGELESVAVQVRAVKRQTPASQKEMRVRVPASGEGVVTLNFGNNGGCKWLSNKKAKYPIQVVRWARGYRRPVAELEVEIDELGVGSVTLPRRAIDLRDREPMRFYLECRGCRFAYTPPIRWVLTQ